MDTLGAKDDGGEEGAHVMVSGVIEQEIKTGVTMSLVRPSLDISHITHVAGVRHCYMGCHPSSIDFSLNGGNSGHELGGRYDQ